MTIGATTFGLRRQAERDAALPALSSLRSAGAVRKAFTLIELILVMAMLATVMAISVPSLSRFFRGRSLDSEAKRFLALTRHAQSRAVSEGVPMVLWVETEQRTYGLNADKSFVEDDTNAEEFTLDEKLQVEVNRLEAASVASRTNRFRNEKLDTAKLYLLRFNPDGFVTASSPEEVIFRQGTEEELKVVQSRNRLNYEIKPGKPEATRR